MELVESPLSKSVDFFKEILDCPNNSESQIDFFEN